AEILEHIAHLAKGPYRLEVLGKSVEGEPIFALALGPESRGTMVRTSVTLSGLHPNEWIGVESHLAMLDLLPTAAWADRALLAVPVANPDGFRRVEKNLRHGRRRFIRHNARGVDLNRNFDERWGKLGLLQRALGGLFHPGSGPASEPEVEALAHRLSRCRIDRALSLHSYGGAVLYPSAHERAPIHDEAEHREWAERVAKAIDPERPYTAKACADWAKGIVAGGLELDWFHARHGAISLLVECSRGGLRPGARHLGDPLVLLDPFLWFNPQALAREKLAIASAVLPFVKGL
ncbi:MAG: hypothetical protein JNK04_25935, partial [Myxococcales bacterium]|nr:hypothetical protein [Myxococcales bacterium]